MTEEQKNVVIRRAQQRLWICKHSKGNRADKGCRGSVLQAERADREQDGESAGGNRQPL